jgi:hypothetical protein
MRIETASGSRANPKRRALMAGLAAAVVGGLIPVVATAATSFVGPFSSVSTVASTHC